MTYKPAALFALLIGGVLGAFGCSRISNTVPPEISRRIVYGTKDGGGGKVLKLGSFGREEAGEA